MVDYNLQLNNLEKGSLWLHYELIIRVNIEYYRRLICTQDVLKNYFTGASLPSNFEVVSQKTSKIQHK